MNKNILGYEILPIGYSQIVYLVLPYWLYRDDFIPIDVWTGKAS